MRPLREYEGVTTIETLEIYNPATQHNNKEDLKRDLKLIPWVLDVKRIGASAIE